MAHYTKLIAVALIGSIFVACDNGQIIRTSATGSLQTQPEYWRVDLMRRVHAGDVVFRRGVGNISELVSYASAHTGERETRWTHAGIAVQVQPGGQVYILHAIDGRGVTLDTLDKFFSAEEAAAGDVLRIEGGEQAAISGMQFLGRPFDAKFSMDDHQELYCTELVIAALALAGIVVDVPLRKVPLVANKVVFPDDLAEALSKRYGSRH